MKETARMTDDELGRHIYWLAQQPQTTEVQNDLGHAQRLLVKRQKEQGTAGSQE